MRTEYYVLLSEYDRVLGIIKNDDLLNERVETAVKDNEGAFDRIKMIYNKDETYIFLVDGEELTYNLIRAITY